MRQLESAVVPINFFWFIGQNQTGLNKGYVGYLGVKFKFLRKTKACFCERFSCFLQGSPFHSGRNSAMLCVGKANITFYS